MKRGLSLMEIVVASAILISAMVPLWGLISTSHSQVTYSAEELKASQIAAEIIEQLENKKWLPDENKVYQLTSGEEGFFTLENMKLTVGSFSEELEMTGEVEVSSYNPSEGSSETSDSYGKIITVKLEYSARNNKLGDEKKSFKLSTYLGRN